jgi:arginine exporter protein ArgO
MPPNDWPTTVGGVPRPSIRFEMCCTTSSMPWFATLSGFARAGSTLSASPGQLVAIGW